MATICDREVDKIEIKVPCKPKYVRTIRRAVADFAESLNMPESDVEVIEIAASEAVSNIVRHAYSNCKKSGGVRVRCAHRRNGITVEVIDNGCGFNAPPDNVVPEADFNREGGFGIILIKILMDNVNYVSKPDHGTTIKMTKYLKKSVRLRDL